jgi:hypothetical protein
VKWIKVKFLGMKAPCTLGWTYTEGTWLYCDYFIWVYLVLCFNLCCGYFNLFCNGWVWAVAYPGIFFGGGGGSTNSVEDRGQNGDLGVAAP